MRNYIFGEGCKEIITSKLWAYANCHRRLKYSVEYSSKAKKELQFGPVILLWHNIQGKEISGTAEVSALPVPCGIIHKRD